MIEVAFVCLAIVALLFLFNVYRLIFVKPEKSFLGNWKVGLFSMILATLFFTTFFILSIGSVGVETTITDGVTNFVQKNTGYELLFALMPFASALYFMMWAFFAIDVLRGFQFLGRKRMTWD